MSDNNNKSNTEMSNYCPNLTNTKLSPFIYSEGKRHKVTKYIITDTAEKSSLSQQNIHVAMTWQTKENVHVQKHENNLYFLFHFY